MTADLIDAKPAQFATLQCAGSDGVREVCLEHAVRSSSAGVSTEAIIARARAFEAYVTGGATSHSEDQLGADQHRSQGPEPVVPASQCRASDAAGQLRGE